MTSAKDAGCEGKRIRADKERSKAVHAPVSEQLSLIEGSSKETSKAVHGSSGGGPLNLSLDAIDSAMAAELQSLLQDVAEQCAEVRVCVCVK